MTRQYVEAATETRLYHALMHIAVVVLILGLRASTAVAPAPAEATGGTK